MPHTEYTSLLRSVGKKMTVHVSHRALFCCINIITHFRENINRKIKISKIFFNFFELP